MILTSFFIVEVIFSKEIDEAPQIAAPSPKLVTVLPKESFYQELANLYWNSEVKSVKRETIPNQEATAQPHTSPEQKPLTVPGFELAQKVAIELKTTIFLTKANKIDSLLRRVTRQVVFFKLKRY